MTNVDPERFSRLSFSLCGTRRLGRALLANILGTAAAISAPSAFSLVINSALSAQQGWVQWSNNGHYYLAVHRPGGRTWAAARAEAQQMGGDLASITSLAENAFVFSLVSDPKFWLTAANPTRVLGPWLGGYQLTGSVAPSAGWTWVTGEAWSLNRWSNGEPNDWQGNQEDKLQFFALGPTPLGYWNDLTGGSLMTGYVVEIAGVPPASAVVFGSDCGTAPPTITAASHAIFGTQQVTLVSGLPASVAFMTAGLSTSSSPSVQLPLPLDFMGMTGCKLYHDLVYMSGELPLLTATTAVHTFSIPNVPQLLATQLHLQGLVLSPGMNPAGLVVTKPVTLTISDH